MGHDVHTCRDHLARPGREQGGVRPDPEPLPVRLGDERAEHRGGDRRIDLDAGSAGAPGLGDHPRPVAPGGDGAGPRRGAGRDAATRVEHAGVVEEGRAGHDRRVVDGRRLDVADQRRARQVGEAAGVARHVPHGGDAAVQRVPEHPLLDLAAVLPARVGGEVHVGVDQARDQVAAREIHHRGAGRDGVGAGREERGDAAVPDDQGHVGPGRGAGAVDDGDMGERRDRRRLGRGRGRGQHGESEHPRPAPAQPSGAHNRFRK